MLQNADKLNDLIQRARQQPEKISPVVLAKINHHLQQTGQPTIPLPWAEQTRQPFPVSPWQDGETDSTPPDGAELDNLKKSYQSEMSFFAANPAAFTTSEHSRMYKIRALISMAESSQKL